VQKSAGKFLGSIFWDQNGNGILLIDYLPQGRTKNSEYYSSLLFAIEGLVKEKRSDNVTKFVLVLHDNSPSHRVFATQNKLDYLGFHYLNQPPFSPYLAPSDYHLFRGLKKQLKSHQFTKHAEVIAAVETWLDGQYSDFFFEWLAKVRATG